MSTNKDITLDQLLAYCIGQRARLYIDETGAIHHGKTGEIGRTIGRQQLRELVAAHDGVQVAASQIPPRRLPAPEGAIMQAEGYEDLALVLQRAFIQAAHGKGKERHANGEPFAKQVMQDGARRFGVGALLFQAFKKSEESQRLPLDRGVNELLGAIVYLAGAIIALERQADVISCDTPQPITPSPANDNAPCCSGGTQTRARCEGCVEAKGLKAESLRR